MRTILRHLGLAAIGIVAACGDDSSKSGDAGGGGDGSGSNVPPHVIPGGGIADGPIDGVVNVYVYDDVSRSPIDGAMVKVGTVSGMTDATGLFTATGVTGPQTIVASAATYAGAEFVGANGSNITMDLKPGIGPTPVTITGHVTGLSGLTFATNHVGFALVTYSQSDLANNGENNFQTPNNGNGCLVTGDACAFTLQSRTGHIALVAAIIDDDTKGTAATDDDTQTLVGWAAHTDLQAIADVSDVDVALIPGDMLGTVTADFGAPPVGLAPVSAFVGLELGASGVMQLPQVVTRDAPSLLVPTLASVGATGYRFSGIAQVTDPAQGPESIVLRRNLPGPTLAAGAWLDPPSGVAVTNTSAAWNPVAGAAVMTVAYTMGAHPLLDITVLDGSTSVVPDPAVQTAATGFSATVSAIGAPGLDLTNFGLDADRAKLVQVSSVPLD